jgi:5-methylcytosine-specific restriction endonuclease McrA
METPKWYRRIFIRDHYRCRYCGRDMMVDVDSFLSIELDHLRPQASQGEGVEDNYVTSCNVCNRLKGKWIPENAVELTRDALIAAARDYIANRRSNWIEEFLRALPEWRRNELHSIPDPASRKDGKDFAEP